MQVVVPDDALFSFLLLLLLLLARHQMQLSYSDMHVRVSP